MIYCALLFVSPTVEMKQKISATSALIKILYNMSCTQNRSHIWITWTNTECDFQLVSLTNLDLLVNSAQWRLIVLYIYQPL